MNGVLVESCRQAGACDVSDARSPHQNIVFPELLSGNGYFGRS